MKPLFSISVDLDGLGCYAAIHGLGAGALPERAQRAVPEVALARFCEVFAAAGIRGTFFAIGREVEEIPSAAAALGRAAHAGHEVASHSWSHDYALSRLPRSELLVDLRRCNDVIESATGRKPRGFRAPGYTLSGTLLAVLRDEGVLYDSSLLPSPAYYLLKAGAMALHALAGRRSQSILGGPLQLFGRRGAHLREGVRELPVSTLPLLRGPVIGTVVLGVGSGAGRLLSLSAFAGGHLNLELHGIDLLDASDDVPGELSRLQPGLATPATQKARRLRELIAALAARAEPCTLEEAAVRLLPQD